MSRSVFWMLTLPLAAASLRPLGAAAQCAVCSLTKWGRNVHCRRLTGAVLPPLVLLLEVAGVVLFAAQNIPH